MTNAHAPRMDSDDGSDGFGVGSTLGAYVLTREIGHGGMGVVFEAVHGALEKRVAIKTLHARVDGAVARQRFQREGRAAARLRHPHVVEVFDAGVERGVAFLVMEYLEGEDLASVLDREGRLAVDEAADLLLPVIAAVSVAHEQGIVHRDLKPENVFLARMHGGLTLPKVLDFGVARMMHEETSLTRDLVVGTPCFMAPEQAANSRAATGLSDQYSLGVILYAAVTGRLPHEKEDIFELLTAIALDPITPPRAIRPELPEAFDALVMRAIQRSPAARFPSARELGAALLPFASDAAFAQWSPVFAPSPRARRTDAPPTLPVADDRPLLDTVEPPRPSSASLAPAAPATLEPPGFPSSRPRRVSTLTDSVRTLDARRSAEAPPRSRVTTLAIAAALVGSVALGLAMPRRTSAPLPMPRAAAAPPTAAPPAPSPRAEAPGHEEDAGPPAAAPARGPSFESAPARMASRPPARGGPPRPTVVRTTAPRARTLVQRGTNGAFILR